MDTQVTAFPATAPSTAAVLTTHERIEVEDLGIEILVPASFAKMLRRRREPLDIHVELDPEPSPLPPLTAEQQSVIDYLKDHGVTPANVLAKHAGYSEKTIKRWCSPTGPLSTRGIAATTGGYGISA